MTCYNILFLLRMCVVKFIFVVVVFVIKKIIDFKFVFFFRLVIFSGIIFVFMGMEILDMIELRKKRIEDVMDQGGEILVFYTILFEKKVVVGGVMMGSVYVYDIIAVSICLDGFINYINDLFRYL